MLNICRHNRRQIKSCMKNATFICDSYENKISKVCVHTHTHNVYRCIGKDYVYCVKIKYFLNLFKIN